jgi:hypothetical protein
VTRDDTSLLVVTSGVAGQLKDFSGEVLHNGSQVDGRASANALSVVALAEKAVDAADGELKPSPVGAGLALSLDFASLSTSRHFRFGLLVFTCEVAQKVFKIAEFV